jgi:hypothetical protein
LSGPQSFEKGTWKKEKVLRAEKKTRRKEWNWGKVKREEWIPLIRGAQVRFHH